MKADSGYETHGGGNAFFLKAGLDLRRGDVAYALMLR